MMPTISTKLLGRRSINQNTEAKETVSVGLFADGGSYVGEGEMDLRNRSYNGKIYEVI